MKEYLKPIIENILYQNGESFLYDDGVDPDVVTIVTEEILTAMESISILQKLETTGLHLARLYSTAARQGFENEAEQFRQFSLELSGIYMQVELIINITGDRLNIALEQAAKSDTPWTDALRKVIKNE